MQYESNVKGRGTIVDGAARFASPAMFDLYCHAMDWIRIADELVADGIPYEDAVVIADYTAVNFTTDLRYKNRG